jgi:endonuclease/exonuclease/phosphatase family metal-dependent hydrolase
MFAGACAGDDEESRESTAPVDTTDPSVRVVSINLLHGTACSDDSDRCDLPARVDLFVQQLSQAACPELVSVQEANQRTVDELQERLPGVCDGAYDVVWDEDPSLDREVVLSTVPVVGARRFRVAGPLRSAFWVRARTDVGLVDYFSTHLASSSDDRPCDTTTCPPPCRSNDSVNTCQMRQIIDEADRRADDAAVVVIGGDLNARPDEPTIDALRNAEYVDTHVAAGNAECDAATGVNCTSGRTDDSLVDLADPSSRQSERIDYLFVGPQRACAAAAGTGLFNAAPAEGTLAHPSDHTGVIAVLACPTTDRHRSSATDATMPVAPSTSGAPGGGPPDPETAEAIAASFNTLFAGAVSDPEVKITALEDADLLRESFFDMYERTKSIASRIVIRIDAITMVDADHANVTYTLLLDGAAVLDHLPGAAVRVDGRWLVSRRTYCDVATQGATEIPEPCRG